MHTTDKRNVMSAKAFFYHTQMYLYNNILMYIYIFYEILIDNQNQKINMAYSSIREFSKHEQHTSIVCQALAHPARLRLVGRIARTENKMLDFKTLSIDLPLSAPTIKQHIDYLRKRKVIILAKNGSEYVYKLNSHMPLLVNLVNNIIDQHQLLIASDVEKEVDNMGLALL